MKRFPLLCLPLAILALAFVRAGDLESRPLPLDSVTVELSGAGKVTGGLLLAEDELVGSLLFVPERTLAAAPRAFIVKLERGRKAIKKHEGMTKLLPVQDFEGVATDGARQVYVLGSHCGRARRGKWERRGDREFLAQATWGGGELRVPTPPAKGPSKNKPLGVYRRLIDDLEEHHGAAMGIGLNAEGLALRKEHLYLGLRSPVPGKKAQVFSAPVERVFSGKSVKWARLQLDLGGGGVRGLFWDEQSKKLLVLSGARTDQPQAPNALWACDSKGEGLTRIHSFSGGEGFPEGVCRISPEELLVVLDAEGARRAPMFRLAWTGKPSSH